MTNAKDRDAIATTVQKYLDGVAQDNPDLVAEAFHPQATLSGYLGPEFSIVPGAGKFIADYMKSSPPISESSPNLSSQIDSIEQVGTMAEAKISEIGLEGMNFKTLFHLHQVEGDWLITAKATYAQPQD